jgi:hypothetical protein
LVYDMTFGQAFDLIARLCSGECVPPIQQVHGPQAPL